MNIKKSKTIGFYIYSYYQAKDVLSATKNFNFLTYLAFRYYLVNNLGMNWIKEISKLLIKDFNNQKFEIILDCKDNPALAINAIRYGFYCIKFNGNNILKKKITNIGIKHNIIINPKVKIIDLKKIKNCNIYVSKIIA